MRTAFTTIVILAVATTAPASDVLDIAYSIPDGGGYDRTWSSTGPPEAIFHQGELLLAASEGGTYCCGYTFCVAVKTLAQRGLLAERSINELKEFKRLWYGDPEQEDRTLVVLAAETLGFGHAVPLDDAQPGDFVQLWRTNGSGHSVIFLDWAIDEGGHRVGFRYRSSQGSTNGVGDATEYFADAQGVTGGRVLRDQTYVCRLAE